MRSKDRPDHRFANGETRLVRALSQGEHWSAHYLLQEASDVHRYATLKTRKGVLHALVIGCKSPDGEALKLLQGLLDKGALLDAPDADGYTPLAWAGRGERWAWVPVLLDAGANPLGAAAEGKGVVAEMFYSVLCALEHEGQPWWDAKKAQQAHAAFTRMLEATDWKAPEAQAVGAEALKQAITYAFQENPSASILDTDVESFAHRRATARQLLREMLDAGICAHSVNASDSPLREWFKASRYKNPKHADSPQTQVVLEWLLAAGANPAQEARQGDPSDSVWFELLQQANDKDRYNRSMAKIAARTLFEHGCTLDQTTDKGVAFHTVCTPEFIEWLRRTNRFAQAIDQGMREASGDAPVPSRPRPRL